MLPAEVLEAAAKALVDYQGKGFGIAECSHRGKEFDGVLDEAIDRCRKLLSIPDTHDVLFLQGGATQLFNTIPMNILNGPADYVVGGEWAKKAASSAQAAYGEKIRIIASSENTNFDRPPTGWKADPAAAYLHVCSNETVHGHRLVEWPEHPNLVVDASSEMMSRPHPIARTAIVYAGAQKNLGPAGVVLTIVRKDLYDRIAKSVPKIFSFKALAGPRAASTRRPRSASTSCSRPSAGSRARGAWPPSRSTTPRRRASSTAPSTPRAASTRGPSPTRPPAAT
jgi:phosphoserine aminotransferase